MKSIFSFLLLLGLLILTIVTQDLFPPMAFLGQAHLMLLPIIFCFAVLALSLPSALFFALVTGTLQGLLVMQVHNQHVEIKLGWFIFFFMGWTFLLQFLSDLADGVRWEIHALGSSLCTATLLLGEFFLLSLSRGHFIVSSHVLFLIGASAGITLFLAPFFYLFFQFLLAPAKPLRSIQAL